MKNIIDINNSKNADVRLYLIHHAGGSHMLYRPWSHLLPGWIKCIALELPGRGMGFGEPLPESMEQVIELFLNQLQTDKPFAIFGHSMGGLIAYELTLRLQNLGLSPVWLGISAFKPPHLKNKENLSRASFNDDQLTEYLEKLGGSKDFCEDRVVMKMMLDIVRSDFRIIESWRMSDAKISDKTAVHSFSGLYDVAVTPQMISSWQDYINGKFLHSTFEGDHFYLNRFLTSLINKIASDLNFNR
ncbi:thioesterase II family protein [Photorhabdus namnaonensis]|uniref:Surfactin synthase thioesterase subunit n=1 Tax=Photorhabdus namnaonensis TaxID=1851568 RepID=A0A1B8YDY0_9GAMM|nr:alpha/beta fold hydrolase [Photorhabdus namnaonensis]OCA53252.1 Surfactin synthase thioesterase subunit [Photorhabdus namnaonensis]